MLSYIFVRQHDHCPLDKEIIYGNLFQIIFNQLAAISNVRVFPIKQLKKIINNYQTRTLDNCGG